MKVLEKGIFLYDNSIKENNKVIDLAEKITEQTNLKWNSAGSSGYVDKNVRDTDSITIFYNKIKQYDFKDDLDKFQKLISNIFLEYLKPIENDYMNFFKINFNDHYDYEILKYSKEQHFVSHIDDHPSWTRRISIVHYFNDNYTGGEIFFPEFNLTIKPKANQTLLFPSNFIYRHTAQKVKEGTKYCMASWIK